MKAMRLCVFSMVRKLRVILSLYVFLLFLFISSTDTHRE